MPAYGIREVCHCVFTPKKTGDPTFIIDTAKMSTLEGASTTVYAQGGSGNSRLMAWEGEKTLTFTIEDALITPESFQALTGASREGNTYKIYPTSFAGYYSVTAYTLMRSQEDGKDYVATISIPNAKLQTQLNLSMAPTGDPSSFTFTFDAFPDRTNNNLLFSLDIGSELSGSLEDMTGGATTTVILNGISYTTEAAAPELNITRAGAITLTDSTSTITATLEAGNVLTNFTTDVAYGTEQDIPLAKGSTSKWYII